VLGSAGFADVSDLLGGYEAWKGEQARGQGKDVKV
jgi:hypothetical protein